MGRGVYTSVKTAKFRGKRPPTPSAPTARRGRPRPRNQRVFPFSPVQLARPGPGNAPNARPSQSLEMKAKRTDPKMPICHFSGILSKRDARFRAGDELFLLPRRIGPPRAHVFPCAAGSSLIAVRVGANGAGTIIQSPEPGVDERRLSIGGIIIPVESGDVDAARPLPGIAVTLGAGASVELERLGELEPCKCIQEKDVMMLCGAIEVGRRPADSRPGNSSRVVARVCLGGGAAAVAEGGGFRAAARARTVAEDAGAVAAATARASATGGAATAGAAAASGSSSVPAAATAAAITAPAGGGDIAADKEAAERNLLVEVAAAARAATTRSNKSKRLLYVVMLREEERGLGRRSWRPAIVDLAWCDERDRVGRRLQEPGKEVLTVWLHDMLGSRPARPSASSSMRKLALGALPLPHTRAGMRASKRVGARSMNTEMGVQPIDMSGDWGHYEPLTLLEQDHIVYLRGLLARRGPFNVGDVILKFPSAYAPAKINSFYALSGCGPPSKRASVCVFRIDVRQDGTVKVATRCSFAGSSSSGSGSSSGSSSGISSGGGGGGGDRRPLHWLSLSNVSFRMSGIISRFEGQEIENSVRRLMFRRGFGDCGGSARVCSVYIPGGHASMVPENRRAERARGRGGGGGGGGGSGSDRGARDQVRGRGAEARGGGAMNQRRSPPRARRESERRQENERRQLPAAAAAGGFLALAAQAHEPATGREAQEQEQERQRDKQNEKKKAAKAEFGSLKSELGSSGMRVLGDSGMQHLGRQVYFQLQNVPDHLLCPIGLSIFKDPVVTRCGHTFERSAIKVALRVSPMCPVCRKKVRLSDLTTNYGIKASVEEHNKLKDLARAMLRLKREQQGVEGGGEEE